MVILKKIAIDNFLTQENIYSKIIRGDIPFTGEAHITNNNKLITIILHRNHDRYEEVLQAAISKNMVTTQISEYHQEESVLRFYINDDKFMINAGKSTTIKITEQNFNPKDIILQDFPKGKMSISIEISLEDEIDNAKVKKEIKDYFMEEKND